MHRKQRGLSPPAFAAAFMHRKQRGLSPPAFAAAFMYRKQRPYRMGAVFFVSA